MMQLLIPYPDTCLGNRGPDSNVHGANMGPTWVLSAPDWLHVGPMNIAIRAVLVKDFFEYGNTVTENYKWYTINAIFAVPTDRSNGAVENATGFSFIIYTYM